MAGWWRVVLVLWLCLNGIFVRAQDVREGQATYGALPLVFEANVGQWSSDVHYLARADAYDAYFTDKGMMLDVP
jgi:hypothetical protein